MTAREELLRAERACVERLEREFAAEAKTRQQLLSKRQKASQTASRRLGQDGVLLQELQLKLATMTAKLREWRELATETADKLKMAQASVVLQSRL